MNSCTIWSYVCEVNIRVGSIDGMFEVMLDTKFNHCLTGFEINIAFKL